MDALKKWLPTLVAIGGLVVTAITPAVQAFWSAHPTEATTLASILAIVANFSPQPHK